jgi:hypothetical protein
MISRAIKKGWTMIEIIIKRKTVEKRMGGKDWEVIDERPFTSEELIESPGFNSTDKLKRVYGYTPKKEIEKQVETEILRQVIDEKDFDFTAVVKAINKLG